MKKLIFILVIAFLGCSADDDYITVTGTVFYGLTNTLVANSKVVVSTHKINAPGNIWAFLSLVSTTVVKTDENGKFSANVSTDGHNQIIAGIGIPKTENNDVFYSSYSLSDINDVEIHLLKLEKVSIYFKNTNPANSDDEGNFNFTQLDGNVSLLNIQNIGNSNEKYFGIDGFSYEAIRWKGTNVNSIINYTVREDKVCSILWKSVKNGVTTENTVAVPIVINQINVVTINY
jgi:hypothetical protein